MMRVAGVDEAGRGPLAGPVVAAAVILDPRQPIEGIGDSKALEPLERERLAALIRSRSLSWAVGTADAIEIDTHNILQATLMAMRRALAGLAWAPQVILVDGNRLPRWRDLWPQAEARAVVRGDSTEASIGAASILAKTTRDALMEQMDTSYPGYGFARHKGYPTAAHVAAIERQGVSSVHRLSFGPVKSRMT
jgi:ribonuclease HII